MLTAKEELTKLLAKAPDVAGQIDPFNVNNILNNLNATNGCVVAENGVTFVSRLHINMDEFDYDIAI
jgi:hypothetical protein